jgi:hypothetical protein
MTKPQRSIGSRDYSVLDNLHSNTPEEKFSSEFIKPRPREIDSKISKDVIVTTGGMSENAGEKYMVSVSKRLGSDTSTKESIGFTIERGGIKHQEPISDIGWGIPDQLQRSRWKDDLERAFDNFQSAVGAYNMNDGVVEESATDLAIEFESAPQEAIPLEVLQVVPEFSQYVSPELQIKIKEKLRDMCEPVKYIDNVDEGEPLTWAGLVEERDEHLSQLEPYFERVKNRDLSIEERKKHMLKVLYSHAVENIRPNRDV